MDVTPVFIDEKTPESQQVPGDPNEWRWIPLALERCDRNLRGTLMTEEILDVLHQASLGNQGLKIYLQNNKVLPIPRHSLHSLQDGTYMKGISPALFIHVRFQF
jgi:hypothetical protein